jgi:hypothetical protein
VSGVNAAASFDKKAILERGEYMGKEFRGKGVHIQLGPGKITNSATPEFSQNLFLFTFSFPSYELYAQP